MGSIKILLGCLVLVAYTHAATINEQIEAIKQASPSERVEMMNRLKLQIAAMNEAEREEALNTLQKSGSHKMNQFRHKNSIDGSGGQYRYRINSQTSGVNRQQGRQ